MKRNMILFYGDMTEITDSAISQCFTKYQFSLKNKLVPFYSFSLSIPLVKPSVVVRTNFPTHQSDVKK